MTVLVEWTTLSSWSLTLGLSWPPKPRLVGSDAQPTEGEQRRIRTVKRLKEMHATLDIFQQEVQHLSVAFSLGVGKEDAGQNDA